MRKKAAHRFSAPTVPCCDLCDPTLLDLVRPGCPDPSSRSQNLKTGIVNEDVAEGLRGWRSRVWEKDYGESLFGPEGILTDNMVQSLASVGPILRLAELENVVGSQWPWFGQYGDNLLTTLLDMSIPPVTPKAQEVRGTKRPATQEENLGRKEQRLRLEVQESQLPPPPPGPTQVNFNPTLYPAPNPASYFATPIHRVFGATGLRLYKA